MDEAWAVFEEVAEVLENKAQVHTSNVERGRGEGEGRRRGRREEAGMSGVSSEV